MHNRPLQKAGGKQELGEGSFSYKHVYCYDALPFAFHNEELARGICASYLGFDEAPPGPPHVLGPGQGQNHLETASSGHGLGRRGVLGFVFSFFF